MKSNSGCEKKKNFQLLTRRKDVIIPENHKKIVSTEFQFKLANELGQKNKNLNIIPNTSIGRIVKNHYFLKLKIKYGGFFAVKSHKIILPLMVYERGYDEKVNPIVIKAPENWNPQVMPIRNFSMIDAVFVEPKDQKQDNMEMAGYDYPIVNQNEVWTDEKFQMMGNKK